MQYDDSAELPYSCEQMSALVADIESYPAFMPHWDDARVIQRDGNRLRVQQQLNVGPVPLRFHSDALFDLPRAIHISSTDGPFRSMQIHWRFADVSDGVCRVTLRVSLDLRGGLGGRLVRGAIETLVRDSSARLIPLFAKRARQQ